MEKLGNLFNKYGSDKDRNGYTPVYQSLFQGMRSNKIKMLEVGIGTMIQGMPSSMVGYSLEGYSPGGSLRAWRDFFENGLIHGIDIQPDTQFKEERINTYLCDSRSEENFSILANENPEIGEYDIILDDGLHSAEAQYATIKNLWKYLKPGGIYIIEDINPNSTIFTTYLHQIKNLEKIAPPYGATVQNPDRSWKVPIMILSKNIN